MIESFAILWLSHIRTIHDLMIKVIEVSNKMPLDMTGEVVSRTKPFVWVETHGLPEITFA